MFFVSNIGMGFVKDIENMDTQDDRPLKDVIIADCGELDRDKLDLR